MTLEGALDTLAFDACVEQLLCPTLKRGQAVVMANLSLHKAGLARVMLAAAGCKFWNRSTAFGCVLNLLNAEHNVGLSDPAIMELGVLF